MPFRAYPVTEFPIPFSSEMPRLGRGFDTAREPGNGIEELFSVSFATGAVKATTFSLSLKYARAWSASWTSSLRNLRSSSELIGHGRPLMERVLSFSSANLTLFKRDWRLASVI